MLLDLIDRHVISSQTGEAFGPTPRGGQRQRLFVDLVA
jgi:hypothetical protein